MAEAPITYEEEELLNLEMQKLAPGFRMFVEPEFHDAIRAAAQAFQGDKKLLIPGSDKMSLPLLIRRVVTDVRREGYGVPFAWWWIYFELQVLKGIDSDPWSEVKWWLYEELRGKGKTLTMHGCQNCLAPETGVRMFDGSVKRADMVEVGDVLMGDDSGPRTVLSTCYGRAPMVRVTPKVGKPYVCTENHKVTVSCKRGRKNHGGRGGWSSTATPHAKYDFPASELLGMTDSRLQCYGIYSHAAEYPEAQLEFDPYIYGLWLGDGTKTKPEITGVDREILDEWGKYFSDLGYSVHEAGDNRRLHVKRSYIGFPAKQKSNPFLKFIRSSSNEESKFIRREYLLASIEQRLQLLAGIIDSDGTLAGGMYYAVSCSDPKLMDGYEELANSLGFRTSRKSKQTNYVGKSGEFHTSEILSICGDVAWIPVRVARKMKHRRSLSKRGVKKHGVSGITLERVGVGTYAGFEVDGNHRFLLEDFTVTHNSGKTAWMGRFTVVMLIAWCKDATFYVTGPKKSHSDDKGWKAVVDWATYIRKNTSLFVASLQVSVSVTKTEVSVSDQHGTGTAKFISAEESSAVRGKKAATHDKSGLIGIMCVIVDEFIENTSLDLRRINNNASSNYNYFQILACNPDPDLIGHPSIRQFSFPRDKVNLDQHRDYRWNTDYGLCVRFAWANCPNNLIGRTRWGYLLDTIRMQRASEKGVTAVAAEVTAWAFGSGSRGAPLDEAQIRLAGTFARPVWTGDTASLCVFDCAFGGKDPATAFIAEVGTAMFESHLGSPIEKSVISAVDQITLPVLQQFTVTQEWLDEMDDLLAYTGGKWPEATKITGVHPGDILNGNYSMAYLAIKTLFEYSIPPGNATFDSSQRGDCTSIMLNFLGEHNVKWFYEGSRSIRDEEQITNGWNIFPLQLERNSSDPDALPEPRQWSAVVTSTISAVWFFACELIKKGYLVSGTNCQRGLNELCARPIVKRRGSAEGKRDVLSKEELKKLGQESPSHAETLAIGIMFAVRFLGVIKLDEPTRAPVVVTAPAVFHDFISSGRRVSSRFGQVKRYHPPPEPAKTGPTAAELAEVNSQGLRPSMEALNKIYMLNLNR